VQAKPPNPYNNPFHQIPIPTPPQQQKQHLQKQTLKKQKQKIQLLRHIKAPCFFVHRTRMKIQGASSSMVLFSHSQANFGKQELCEKGKKREYTQILEP
jgi:hypothetical protein